MTSAPISTAALITKMTKNFVRIVKDYKPHEAKNFSKKFTNPHARFCLRFHAKKHQKNGFSQKSAVHLAILERIDHLDYLELWHKAHDHHVKYTRHRNDL